MIVTAFLGMSLGIWASGIAALMQGRPLTTGVVYARLIGGVLGGLLAAVTTAPGDLSLSALLLIALAGYVGADLVAAFVAPRRQ